MSDHPKEVKKKTKLSKNKAHYILRAERKKLNKYQEKMSLAIIEEEQTKWATTVEKAQTRILRLEEIFQKVNKLLLQLFIIILTIV
jgi:hypothetical protein